MKLKESDKPIAIASRLDSIKAISLSKEIIKFLIEQKIKAQPESRIANIVGYPMLGRSLSKMTRENTAAIISIGGDGTILRVAQNLPLKDTPPILGINVGAVGYLSEFDMPNPKNFKNLIELDFHEEKCIRLSCEINGVRNFPPALNEVLIITSRPSKALGIVIKVDGFRYSSGYVDGVLISTPIGSTAYCLSAGGCIMVPNLEAIQIVPICPFTRSGLKPLVLDANSKIEIELLRPKLNALITVDGQKEVTISPAKRIIIKKSKNNISFLRASSTKKSFFSRLNKKLLPDAKFPVPQHDSPEE
ncbi:MAG: NAD(+)/NADH kinase [Promethearchaeota archaeon]